MNIKDLIKKVLVKIPYVIVHIDKSNITQVDECLPRLIRGYKRLLWFLPDYPFKYYIAAYSQIIIKETSKDIEKKEKFQTELLSFFYKNGIKEQMFTWCFLSECKLIDNTIIKKIMDHIISCEDAGERYWLCMDISYTTFREGVGFYKDFYIDRKKILQKIAEETNLKKLPQKRDTNGEKICIITYQLFPDIHNSVQRVCSTFANRFSCYSKQVLVLCLETTYKTRAEKKKYYTNCRTPKSSKYLKKIASFFNDNVLIQYAVGSNYKERAQDGLDKLFLFNPSIIIDLSDEYSPFSYIYSKQFFTVYFPLRRGISSQGFNKIIISKNTFKIENEIFDNIIEGEPILDWCFPEYVPKDMGNYQRSEIGLPQDSFVIISIGNNGAFENELVNAMRNFLLLEKKCVWLLVGFPASEYLRETCVNLIEERKIIEWGYEKNLLGICSVGNVVLRQNITGGSGGTAIAAMKGLPIVMTNKGCDASRWLGYDYSNISDTQGLIDEIKRLKEDSIYYQQKQNQVLNLVNKVIDTEEKWKDLYDMVIQSRRDWIVKSNE